MKRLILSITQRDIDKGEPAQCDACPVALSLKRRFPGKDIDVNFERARIGKSGAFWITRDVEEWMLAFDNNEPTNPTRFCVDLRGRV